MTLQNHLNTILEKADYGFLKQANTQIFDKLKDFQDIKNIEAKSKFRVGEKVCFDGKRGRVEGTITKIGRKNIVVKPNDGLVSWRVSPSLVNKIQ